MKLQFRDGQVSLENGEMFIVPGTKEHRPVAADECQVSLIEPACVINTVDVAGRLTAASDVWI